MSSRDCPGENGRGHRGCIRRLTMEVIKKPFSTLHQTSNARGHRSCSHFGSTCALTGACHGTRRPRAGRYVLRHRFHMLCLRCLAGAAGGRRLLREVHPMPLTLSQMLGRCGQSEEDAVSAAGETHSVGRLPEQG